MKLIKAQLGTVALAATLLMSGLTLACTRAEAIEEIPTGTEVTVTTADGTLVRGKIAKVNPEAVTLTGESPAARTEVARTSIKEVRRVSARWSRKSANSVPACSSIAAANSAEK